MGSYSKKSSAEWIIDQLNVENAKLLAFFLVIGFIGYHGVLHLKYGSDSCTWLLTAGRYKGDHEWQPYGCMLHKYSKTDARRCFRYLAFWGKYNSFAFIGDSRLEQLYEYFISVVRTRLDLDSPYSTVEHRMPNYTYVDNKLRLSVTFVYSDDVSKTMVDQFRTWQRSDQPPSVIIASTGLQLLKTRNTTDLVLEEYKRNLTHLVQAIDSLAARKTQVLWKLIEGVDVNKLQNDYKRINNNDIDSYNRAAVEILTHSAAKIWNGVLWVVRSAWGAYESARSHLQGYTPVSRAAPSSDADASGSSPSLLAAMARLGLIMSYFYLCDRTNFFMKENKYYSEWSFWLPVGYVFALGLFFTEDSKSNTRTKWKGWMQLVILVYQVTGASKVLPIYMLVRTLVSAYLFLTGYGHFYYTWKTGDTGLVRYLRVIFRLNFLTVVLCLTMNRPYQFYSFVPLVSFWYTLMFVIFALPPHITPSSSHTVESRPYQYLYITIKVIGLLVIVTVLYMSEVFFQKIFVTRPWKALFVNSDDDIHQWWLQWKQDRAWGGGATALALLGLAAYAAFALLCSNASDCDEIQSYVSFLPVLSYAWLRNARGALRARHSALFAWVGRVSLELAAGGAHALGAADRAGRLVLLPGAPTLSVLVAAYVFLCAAHDLRRLTAQVAPRAVPDDWRRALRNVAIFLAVLVPIGIHDGMF
ncbi:hypothetical protein HW555_010152 [Spodoptera exigua]|uniref:Cas1p 10 TM acyl transferase domain-containing protein n=1 Tax=Spodoptera exigua TaxID=7107 RepID=A0A835GAG7_SPOEX|nr:hypothetical protein HW555_010152 [Spodoptera exigua]